MNGTTTFYKTTAINEGTDRMNSHQITWPFRLLITGALFASALSQTAMAAGGRAGEFYINYGAGIFSPSFAMGPGNSYGVDGGPDQTNVITTCGNGEACVVLSGSTNEGEPNPENVDILAFGGAFGYKFTNNLSFEVGLDITFPNIQAQDIGLVDVIGGDAQTGQVQIQQPSILPITVTGLYTLMPDRFISPYVGAGVMFANFKERRAFMTSDSLLKLEQGAEVGFLLKLGALLDIGSDSYAFVEVNYAYIDQPGMKDRFGDEIEVEQFDAVHLKGGMGFAF